MKINSIRPSVTLTNHFQYILHQPSSSFDSPNVATTAANGKLDKRGMPATKSLDIGVGFDSYEQIQDSVAHYEQVNNVRLYTRASRTVKSVMKRSTKGFELPAALKYGELNLCCHKGGKIQQSKATGKRAPKRSIKQDCPMSIVFGPSYNHSQLVIKKMLSQHNHDLVPDTNEPEPIHPGVDRFVTKLVWGDPCIRTRDVKNQLLIRIDSKQLEINSPKFQGRARKTIMPSRKQLNNLVTRARLALRIDEGLKEDLTATTQTLQDKRKDEKFIYDFTDMGQVCVSKTQSEHTSESVREEDKDNDETFIDEDGKAIIIKLIRKPDEDVKKILFCHQTPFQQRIMKRYHRQLIITEVQSMQTRLPFPVYALMISTNVDHQLVGLFILRRRLATHIQEALDQFKEWNPSMKQKFIICDYSPEQIQAVEQCFPNSFLRFSETTRKASWQAWLTHPDNNLVDCSQEIFNFLQDIACSCSEETLQLSARLLEASDVWKSKENLRIWFQSNWLTHAKRWVDGYRPADYLTVCHLGPTVDSELCIFENVLITQRKFALKETIEQLVNNIVACFHKKYIVLNEESNLLRQSLQNLYLGVPAYLHNLPGKAAYHIYERIKSVNDQTLIITDLNPGVFAVQGTIGEESIVYTISFGDRDSHPTCNCPDWQTFHLPCIHMCAIFDNRPDWDWDMLSDAYRSNPILNIDLAYDPSRPAQTNISCQTDPSPSLCLPQLGECNTLFRTSFPSIPPIIMETSQTLATSCKASLQRLNKLPLQQYSKETLHRFQAQLSEMNVMFSSSVRKLKPMPAETVAVST